MSTAILQEILDAERKIDDIIEKARKKADRVVHDAQASSKASIEKRKALLENSHQEKIDAVRKQLEEKKRKKIEETRKAVTAIEKNSEKNQEKAVQHICREFLNGILEHD